VSLRVCLVASARYPIREPFAGGLEAQTHALARELVAAGHRVSVFAAPGSDPALDVRELDVPTFRASAVAEADVHAPTREWMAEHHAYLSLMLDLQDRLAGDFDVVHNNSLHHLPVAMAAALPMPVVTTLHTPPLPWLESALALRPGGTFVAVSDTTRELWRDVVPSRTIRNGVDTRRWRPGPGGAEAVWSGRITAEKAPHEAIDAARLAGLRLRLVGPVSDPDYFRREVAPRLGDDVEHVGHLRHDELADLVGRSCVAFVTPAWDEPYGLVAAEAMACGTPVAAYARGALPEVVPPEAGRLATPGDPADLARAACEARGLPRAQVRGVAVEHCSLERMVAEYVDVYSGLVTHLGRAA